jgi:hypothetical protein
MKILHPFALIAFALPLASASAHASEKEQQASPDRLPEIYRVLARFDTDKDGRLCANEKAALSKAIASDALKLPMAPKLPFGNKPPSGFLAGKLAGAYQAISPYDKNSDRELNSTEHAEVKSDITAGKLKLPMPMPDQV